MPRRVRSADLETRSRRLRLPIHKNPQCPVSIGQGLTLEYRRCKGPGRWVVKVADGQGGNYEVTLPNIVADDFELADGEHILDFWMACDKARVLARGGRGGGRPETLAEAITSYEADLKLRDGDLGNATRIRHHLPTWLLNKPVPMLLERDFLRLRNDMIARGIRGPNLSRTFKVLRAVLNLAARHDKRILNRDQWRDGLRLAGINTFKTRNQILDDDQVRRIVAESYRLDPAFGLYVETHAVTGARSSQISRLNICDLQDARPDPRLMMPPSRKGAKREEERAAKPVPIPPALAAKLRMAAAGRAATAALLVRADGKRWSDNHLRIFATAAKRAGLEYVGDERVTIYALRHSSIVRAILAGQPMRVVAATHDTSTAMLERTYSAKISDVADKIAREGLLDFDQTPSTDDNVVPLPRRS